MSTGALANPFLAPRSANDPMRRNFAPVISDHMSGFEDALDPKNRCNTEAATESRIRANTLLYIADAAAFQAAMAVQTLRMQGANILINGKESATNMTPDFTDFITAQIHLTLDIYPRLYATRLVSVQPLNRPSGYVFSIKRRDESDRDMSDVALFNKDYANDPGEGQQIKKIKHTYHKTMVEVEYKKLMAEHTHELDVAVRSQYSLDIGAMNQSAVAEELAWEVDREIIDDLVDFAGTDTYWDPTAGGTYNSMAEGDRQAYDRNFVRIALTSVQTDMAAAIYRQPNWYVAGTNVIKHLRRMPEYNSKQVTKEGDQVITSGSIIMSGSLEDKPVLHDPQLDPDLMLVGYTEQMNPFYAGYVFAPFGMASILTAAFTEPNNLVTRQSRALAFAKCGIKQRQYARLWMRAGS